MQGVVEPGMTSVTDVGERAWSSGSRCEQASDLPHQKRRETGC